MKTNKNIHILTTDKPSRLYEYNNKLFFGEFGHNLNRNIYITSDEEIKEGDWFYNTISLKPEPFKACENGDGYVNCSKYSHYRIDCKKIILTTDQDLIGVQAIDDEFLDWFVKNPNCEFVEVYEVEGKLFAEPTIPQEESKQIKCYCGHTITCDCESLEEFKQETLEEAARIYAKIHPTKVIDEEERYYNSGCKDYDGFIVGAKWQSERMYSEEEVIQLLQKALTHQDDREIGDLVTAQGEIRPPNFYSWFEKFKKR